MPDIYDIYTHIRAYWFDYGKVLPHTLEWIDRSYEVDTHFTDNLPVDALA